MYITTFDNEYSPLLLELVACSNGEHSSLNDILCGRLLVAEITVRTFSAYSFLPVCLPMP